MRRGPGQGLVGDLETSPGAAVDHVDRHHDGDAEGDTDDRCHGLPRPCRERAQVRAVENHRAGKARASVTRS